MEAIIFLTDKELELTGKSIREIYWNFNNEKVKVYQNLTTEISEKPRLLEILGMRYIIGFKDGYLFYRIDNIADFDRFLKRVGQSGYAIKQLRRTQGWQIFVLNNIKTEKGTYKLLIAVKY